MIRSMTGFGRGEASSRAGKVTIEIRTLNHRFLETIFRLPESFSIFEEKIKYYIRERIGRGRVNLSLSFERTKGREPLLLVDRNLARKYYRLLDQLKEELDLKDDIGINQIISFPNVLQFKEEELDFKGLWISINMALERALKNLLKMRENEGRILYRDLIKRIKDIWQLLLKIERRHPQAVEAYKQRLVKRTSELSGGLTVDRDRLETELAIFARNSDITEEIVRLKSHLRGLNSGLLRKKEMGRELDFIVQEIYREANTIGSKTIDAHISKWVIGIKSELEKVREQLQNVE